MPIAVRFEEIADPAALAARWRALEARAGAGASFFTGWVWIGSWLGALQAAGAPLPAVLAFADSDRPGDDRALALLGRAPRGGRLGTVPALWLNRSGVAAGDRPFVEYNGLLCAAGYEAAAAESFCAALAARRDWRALVLSGVPQDSALVAVPGVRRRRLEAAEPAPYVDLAAVRAAGGDYLSLLSANTRRQIRRSLKDEPEPPVAEAAADAATARRWLTAMAALNAGRHPDEAWEDPFFRDFVGRLVQAGLAAGSVELLRIGGSGRGADGETLGYLVVLRYGGRAMVYQSAFAPPRTVHGKPGLMSHAVAVARYAGQGLAVYSFLAGHDRFKRSLATDSETLCWWVLERFEPRLEVLALARRLLRRR